jgi:hypothetical protein
MKMKKTAWIVCAAVLAAGIPARAQAPAGGARQRVQENLSILRLVRLTQALELTEDQTAKIFPPLTKIEKERLEIQKALSAGIQDLRRMLRDPQTKDADYEPALRQIREGRNRIAALEEETNIVLEKHLTVVQKARYQIFQIEFYRGLGETLNQARQRLGRNGLPPIKK